MSPVVKITKFSYWVFVVFVMLLILALGVVGFALLSISLLVERALLKLNRI